MQVETKRECVKLKIDGKLEGIRFPCIAQKKYDGIFVTVYVNNGVCTCVTKGGMTLSKSIENMSINCVLLAELTVEYGDIGSLYLTMEAMQNLDGPHKFDRTPYLYAFDVLMVDGKLVHNLPLIDRLEILAGMDIRTAHMSVIDSKEQLDAWIEEGREAHWEGVVVKNINESLPLQTWVKVKNCIEQEAVTKEFKHDGGVFCKVQNVDQWIPVPETVGNYNGGFGVGDIVEIRHLGITSDMKFRDPIVLRAIKRGEI